MTLQPTAILDSEPDKPSSFWERHSRQIFIVALFVTVFIVTRLTIRAVNNLDYLGSIDALQAFWAGATPYTSNPSYKMPPWAIFFLAPLVNQPIETWLALAVAIFVTAVIDLGKPSGLIQLAHPAFLLLLASSNPEWLVIGTGLWLLAYTPRGWGRGVAWLLLTCKPQTSFLFLLVDGWAALRQRDWKAFGLAGVVAVLSVARYPQVFERLSHPFDWTASTLPHYGVLGAGLATLFIVVVRRRKLKTTDDWRVLGLLLAPIWSIYMLQYSYVAVVFTMRAAGWWRNALYLAGSYGLAYLFWRDFHVAEQIGALGMVLLAAVLQTTPPRHDLDSGDAGLGDPATPIQQPSKRTVTIKA